MLLFLIQLILITLFLFQCYHNHRDLHSFPTRRSSDLISRKISTAWKRRHPLAASSKGSNWSACFSGKLDRKSTRLNSSHPSISYAVFCLKKKTSCVPVPSARVVYRPVGGAANCSCRPS